MSSRGWKEVLLEEISDMKYGKMPKKDNIVNEGYPIYSGYRITGYYKEYMFYEPQLIVVARGVGGTGDVKLSPPKCFLTNLSIAVMVDERKVSKTFLYYYLTNKNLRKLDSGSAQSQITITDLRRYNVMLPPVFEQKAIAATLSCLDDMIELNNHTNQVLEEIAQAIFKHWFVDFEFPNEDGQPYKSCGGVMVDSELGEIPAGWRIGKLEDIAHITMGQSPSGSSYNEEKDGIIFYQGRTDFGKRYPTIRLYTTEPKRLATKGDILLSVRAPVGDINVASEDCCIGRGLASLRSRDDFTSYLLYQLLNLRGIFNIYNTEGTVFGSINKNTLNNVPVLIPLDNNIQAFQYLVKKIDELIEINSIQIKNLTSTRNTLLPKLMSGEIRVPVEEVV